MPSKHKRLTITHWSICKRGRSHRLGMTHVEKGQEEETHEAESMHCDGTHFQIKEKKNPDKKKLKEVYC